MSCAKSRKKQIRFLIVSSIIYSWYGVAMLRADAKSSDDIISFQDSMTHTKQGTKFNSLLQAACDNSTIQNTLFYQHHTDTFISRYQEKEDGIDLELKRDFRKLTSGDGKISIYSWNIYLNNDLITWYQPGIDIITENIIVYNHGNSFKHFFTNSSNQYRTIGIVANKDGERVYLLAYHKLGMEFTTFGIQAFSFIDNELKLLQVFEEKGKLKDELMVECISKYINRIGVLLDIIISPDARTFCFVYKTEYGPSIHHSDYHFNGKTFVEQLSDDKIDVCLK